MEVRRVGVEVAEVEVVDGLHVVAHRAVVATVRPVGTEVVRPVQGFGDLEHRGSRVRHPERLVVQVLVGVHLRLQELPDFGVAPCGPVVLGEADLAVTESLEGEP